MIPLFSSHYGLNGSSLLTLDEPGKAKPGNPISVFDLTTEGGLKEVVLVEDKIDSYTAAYKTASKLKLKLCFGLKLAVCANMLDKTPASERTESKVVIFALNTQGYSDLIRIHNRAANEGSYEGAARADWELLGAYWTANLHLALPFFSSFIARNTLSFDSVIPRLPVDAGEVTVFKEVGSELPFEPLIAAAVDRYVAATPKTVAVPCKSIYYSSAASFEAYVLMRAIANRSAFDRPEVPHLSSAAFSWESYKKLAAPALDTAA